MKKLRVGLVGARPDQGWAGRAHVPAIRAVEALELAAVATRDPSSAGEAERAFGVRGYSDPHEMIRDPDIDLVAVVVKAPEHRPLVEAAIEAGKATYCEWPLGRSLAESRQLASAAEARGIPTCIGLQGRSSPSLSLIKSLIAEGRLGRVLSTTMVASDLFSTGSVTEANAYMLDPANGATPLSIVGGHTLDALCRTLGEFTDLGSMLRVSRPQVRVVGPDELKQSSLPDQIVLAGAIAGEVAASVHIRAGETGDRALVWEVQGEKALLRATSQTYVHWKPLELEVIGSGGTTERLSAPADLFTALEATDGAPYWNIARHYARFAATIVDQGTPAATFDDAVQRHELIEAVASCSL